MSEVNLMVSQDCRQYQINVRYSVDVLVPVVDKLIVRAITLIGSKRIQAQSCTLSILIHIYQ